MATFPRQTLLTHTQVSTSHTQSLRPRQTHTKPAYRPQKRKTPAAGGLVAPRGDIIFHVNSSAAVKSGGGVGGVLNSELILNCLWIWQRSRMWRSQLSHTQLFILLIVFGLSRACGIVISLSGLYKYEACLFVT